MNRSFLIAALAFVCGAASAGYYFSRRNQAVASDMREQLIRLQAEVANATRPVAPASPQPVAASTSPDKPTAQIVKTDGGGEPGNLAGNWQERLRQRQEEGRRLKVEERLAALRGRLRLTTQQAEALRPLLGRMLAPAGGFPILDAASGDAKIEMSMEKMKERREKAMADRTAAEQELLATLTPEQKAAYGQWKDEDRANRVELRANQDLAALQSQMSLTPEQKDKAFAAFSKLAADDGPAEPDLLEDPSAFMGRREKRLAAMKEILTPEQLALFERNGGGGMINISLDGGDSLFVGGEGAGVGIGAAAIRTVITVDDGKEQTPPPATKPAP